MLNYYSFTAGNTDYKLKLTTAAIVEAEEKIGYNLIQLFYNTRMGKLPTVKEMVTILHYSLQAYHHNLKLNDTYAIFDAWLDDHQIMQFLPIILEIFKVSGIIKLEEEAAEDTDTEKN